VTDESGEVEQLLSYYPSGATRLDEKESTFDERRKFTGHELDSETGLYYMQAWYHNPEVGVLPAQFDDLRLAPILACTLRTAARPSPVRKECGSI
jgi:hypothetical protein